MEINEYYKTKKILENKIDKYFGDESNPHYGDRGYQDLLEALDYIEEQIKEIE